MSGAGPRAVGTEQGQVDERHPRRSPVLNPTEELRKDKGGVTTVEDERGPGLDFFVEEEMWKM